MWDYQLHDFASHTTLDRSVKAGCYEVAILAAKHDAYYQQRTQGGHWLVEGLTERKPS